MFLSPFRLGSRQSMTDYTWAIFLLTESLLVSGLFSDAACDVDVQSPPAPIDQLQSGGNDEDHPCTRRVKPVLYLTCRPCLPRWHRAMIRTHQGVDSPPQFLPRKPRSPFANL
jgi:hypothetical protein